MKLIVCDRCGKKIKYKIYPLKIDLTQIGFTHHIIEKDLCDDCSISVFNMLDSAVEVLMTNPDTLNATVNKKEE